MTSVCIFKMCLDGFHQSCIRYGPPPTTMGGSRVVCGCSCHVGQDPDWKPSDADRMATYFAFEHGTDPRVDQIVEGRFVRRWGHRFFGFWLGGAEGAPSAYKHDREPEKTTEILAELRPDFFAGLEPR